MEREEGVMFLGGEGGRCDGSGLGGEAEEA